jgi:hypothetical protein
MDGPAPAPREQGATQPPKRDLDAIFGNRPAQPASSATPPPAQSPSSSASSSSPSTTSSSPGAGTVVGSSASKPDWWLEGGDKLPPLGGAPLSAKGDRTGVRGVAEAAAQEEMAKEREADDEEEEDAEEVEIAFGPAAYNSSK